MVELMAFSCAFIVSRFSSKHAALTPQNLARACKRRARVATRERSIPADAAIAGRSGNSYASVRTRICEPVGIARE
jgi:hypothetical protein